MYVPPEYASVLYKYASITNEYLSDKKVITRTVLSNPQDLMKRCQSYGYLCVYMGVTLTFYHSGLQR